MNSHKLKEPLVLSFFFNTNGFGYAVFEGVVAPVDWGIKEVEKKADYYEQARLILHLFDPTVIVLQDCAGALSRCTDFIRRLVAKVAALAKKKGIRVVRYSRADIRTCFAYYGARSKDEIAREIAKLLPEFERLVPRMRGAWRREHYRMVLFDALALATTYYANELLRPPT